MHDLLFRGSFHITKLHTCIFYKPLYTIRFDFLQVFLLNWTVFTSLNVSTRKKLMFWPWKDLLVQQSCWVGSSRKEVVKKSSNDLQYFFILSFMLFSLVRSNLDQCNFMSLSILMKWIQPSSLQYWNQKSNHYCYAHLQYLWRMYDPIYKAFVFCFCILWSYVFIIVILELYPSSLFGLLLLHYICNINIFGFLSRVYSVFVYLSFILLP